MMKFLKNELKTSKEIIQTPYLKMIKMTNDPIFDKNISYA